VRQTSILKIPVNCLTQV